MNWLWRTPLFSERNGSVPLHSSFTWCQHTYCSVGHTISELVWLMIWSVLCGQCWIKNNVFSWEGKMSDKCNFSPYDNPAHPKKNQIYLTKNDLDLCYYINEWIDPKPNFYANCQRSAFPFPTVYGTQLKLSILDYIITHLTINFHSAWLIIWLKHIFTSVFYNYIKHCTYR